MKVHLCGVRGSTPATGIDFVRYGGDTLCLALAHDGAPAPTLVLDAGTGLKSVTGLLDGAPFAGTILLSHLHWDHVLGLPFFSAADHPDANVTVMLPEQQSGDGAAAVLCGIMSPPYFPIRPTELRGEWSFGTVAPGGQQIQGFTVLAREIPHKGGRTFGYRVSDGHSALAYLPDHCPTELGPGEDGFGEYHPAALELAKDVDVLVHDAQLFPAELSAEAVYGHALADYAVELSRRAHARSVVLIHHRHTRTDDALDELALRFRGPSPRVIVAAQGITLDL
ncbi:MAG TPA: MBL fold metallo-hydrolase [Solirubrobacteraceae bacterium]